MRAECGDSVVISKRYTSYVKGTEVCEWKLSHNSIK